MDNTTLIPTYNPLPIALERGEGVFVWDTDGNKYLDLFAGIAVSCLGHSHPAVIKAISEQAHKIIHTSNAVNIPQQIALANFLTKIADMQQVFFANSGAEANEAAIKLAHLYGHKQGIDAPIIVTMQRSFHGRSMANISASGNPKIQQGFEPLLPGFHTVAYNDLAALTALSENPNIVAVMLEPIQGEGGIIQPSSGYLQQVRNLCTKNNWLLILDEVQTGIGRTGKWFAWQHEDAKPDILTSAKALGGGFPIGACLVAEKACGLFNIGSHGSTFGGNPLACHTALSVLETIEDENLCQHAAQIGAQLKQLLIDNFNNHPKVVEIRGTGLMLGMELHKPAREALLLGLKAGLLLNVTSVNTLRFVPPLILQEEHFPLIVAGLNKILTDF